jgi:hypothetical protein
MRAVVIKLSLQNANALARTEVAIGGDIFQ